MTRLTEDPNFAICKDDTFYNWILMSCDFSNGGKYKYLFKKKKLIKQYIFKREIIYVDKSLNKFLIIFN